MGDLIARLTSFLNLAALFAITVPGMVLAAALGVIFWPPFPEDVIMTAAAKPADPCSFAPVKLARSRGKYRDSTAKDHQRILDNAADTLRACIVTEASRLGDDSARIVDKQYQIATDEKERDSLQARYLSYANSGSSLAPQFRARYRAVMDRIERNQDSVRQLRVSHRARRLTIALDSQYLATVEARLADPGRLRPAKSFDDIWAALTDHVIAFLSLSIIAGYAISPLNTALFGGLFDMLAERWNVLRARRFRVKRSLQTH
ncbi:MAG: hypothetical protein Q8K82_16055 [Gemmatimonadaceae bacterium]|nr:hypothetical protein [Gemmatimonadaceae bacterium]